MLVRVCHEFCLEVWTEALNVAKAPTNSELRKAENINYPEDLREPPKAVLGPGIDATSAPAVPK